MKVPKRAAGLLRVAVVFFAFRPGSPAPVIAQDACDYRGGTRVGGQGVIVGFLSREQAERLISVTQAKVHATISPRYITNRRVVIGLANGARVVALLPDGMIAKPGDRVAFAPGQRDISWPCSYIPKLVIGFVRGPGRGLQ